MGKKILFVGGEVLPFAATGGLGDVLGSLPAAIKAASAENDDVRVVMPLYATVSSQWRDKMTDPTTFTVQLAWRQQSCCVKSLVKDGVTYYFVENDYYFGRDTMYGHYDDAERYAFFCMAVCEMLTRVDYYPDILHAHDWQAALSIVYLNYLYRSRPGYENIKTVFTIHNIEYQGIYDFAIFHDVLGLGDNAINVMQYDGCVNLMKGAIQCADRVTTVSPRYSQEILTPEYSHGLWYILRDCQDKLSGILNGIDYNYYNPQRDTVITQNYTWRSANRKATNKLALQEEVGLPIREDVPMVALISRLVSHKGLDLVREIAERLLNEREIQLVVLGKGSAEYEEFFIQLENKYPSKVKALIQYDRDLSKRIYAACDIFMMPSLSEPCGLSQMIASRYGAIPVTRETGGLYDSIKCYWMDENGDMHGNGFTFASYNSADLLNKAEAATDLWYDAPLRNRLVTKIMKTDFSWKVSAEHYLQLYRNI